MAQNSTYTEKELEQRILQLPDSYLDFPFGEKVAVFKTNEKMFALIQVGSKPTRLSLKCDPELAEVLRDKYESVMPGYHLNKRHWNTIVLTGQLENSEIDDLIRHSYELVTSK